MPTVDETGTWSFELPAQLPAANLTPRLAAAHARTEAARAEFQLISRDAASAARAARAAIDTAEAHMLFEKAKALHAVSQTAFAQWRRAELALRRERRLARQEGGRR